MSGNPTLDEAKNLLIQGQPAQSAQAFSAVIQGGENTAIAYLSRGVARLQLDETKRAIEDFSRSLQIEPSNPRAWYYRGTAHMLDRNLDRAVKDFKRAIDLRPDHGLAYLARGVCYEEMGFRDAAARDIRSALMETKVSAQRFVDGLGMIRTMADRAFHLTIGEGRHPELSETEWQQLKGFVEKDTAD